MAGRDIFPIIASLSDDEIKKRVKRLLTHPNTTQTWTKFLANLTVVDILGGLHEDPIVLPLSDAIQKEFSRSLVAYMPTNMKTHVPAGMSIYGEFRVLATIYSLETSPIHSQKVDDVLAVLRGAPLGPYTIFPPSSLRTEADINDCIANRLLYPCITAINNFARYYYERYKPDVKAPIVTLRSRPFVNETDEEFDSDGGKISAYVDHAIMCDDEYLILIEEKAPYHVKINALDNFKTEKGAVLKDVTTNAGKQLTQVVKYVQLYQCENAILTDGLTLMKWTTPKENELPQGIFGETKALAYWDMQPERSMNGMKLTAYTSLIYHVLSILYDTYFKL